MYELALVWVTPTLIKVEKQVLCSLVNVEVSCIHASQKDNSMLLNRNKVRRQDILYCRITELCFLHSNPVKWKLGML
jgi:hypothetical protein